VLLDLILIARLKAEDPAAWLCNRVRQLYEAQGRIPDGNGTTAFTDEVFS